MLSICDLKRTSLDIINLKNSPCNKKSCDYISGQVHQWKRESSMNLCSTWSTKQYSAILPLLFRPYPVCLQSVFLDGPSMLEFLKYFLSDPFKVEAGFPLQRNMQAWRCTACQHWRAQPHKYKIICEKVRSNTIVQHQRMHWKRPCRHQKYFRLIMSRLVRFKSHIDNIIAGYVQTKPLLTNVAQGIHCSVIETL